MTERAIDPDRITIPHPPPTWFLGERGGLIIVDQDDPACPFHVPAHAAAIEQALMQQDYDPATSPDSPRFGSCCDPAKKRE